VNDPKKPGTRDAVPFPGKKGKKRGEEEI